MAKFAKGLLSLFFPQRCVLCGGTVAGEELCCGSCRAGAPPAGDPTPQMAHAAPSLAVFGYRGPVRRAILRLKLEGDLRTAAFLAEEMAALLTGEHNPAAFDCITYVPMQPEREAHRGYNQARILADLVAEATGLTVRDDLLTRDGVFVQHQLAASFRQKSAPASFFAMEGAALQGERVLLVDDVVTTGSTAVTCVKLLRELGAGGVVVLSAAR